MAAPRGPRSFRLGWNRMNRGISRLHLHCGYFYPDIGIDISGVRVSEVVLRDYNKPC